MRLFIICLFLECEPFWAQRAGVCVPAHDSDLTKQQGGVGVLPRGVRTGRGATPHVPERMPVGRHSVQGQDAVARTLTLGAPLSPPLQSWGLEVFSPLGLCDSVYFNYRSQLSDPFLFCLIFKI